MSDLHIRTQGRAGRITLTRAAALNALTLEMCHGIERALDLWTNDASVELLVIDAEGDKAFCAGGDIQEMYTTGTAGDFTYGDRFWRDEYRMNAKLFRFPKPVVTFLQGFTLGGGVGVGCHGSHRIVCETSRIALPEVSIGLVPDVGGSLLLARAPGHIGEYLGLTGERMGPADALFAGFADYYIPREGWPDLLTQLCATGDCSVIDRAGSPSPPAPLARLQPRIDACFGGTQFGDIHRALHDALPEELKKAISRMARHAPLSLCATVGLIHKVRSADRIAAALDHEFRFTSRAMEHGDFIEGIRAAIIERDAAPKWRHAHWQDVTGADVLRMTYPTKPPLDLTGAAP